MYIGKLSFTVQLRGCLVSRVLWIGNEVFDKPRYNINIEDKKKWQSEWKADKGLLFPKCERTQNGKTQKRRWEKKAEVEEEKGKRKKENKRGKDRREFFSFVCVCHVVIDSRHVLFKLTDLKKKFLRMPLEMTPA